MMPAAGLKAPALTNRWNMMEGLFSNGISRGFKGGMDWKSYFQFTEAFQM